MNANNAFNQWKFNADVGENTKAFNAANARRGYVGGGMIAAADAGEDRRRHDHDMAEAAAHGLTLVGGAARNDAMAATTTPSGLKFEDVVVGNGDTAAAGQDVTVHYTGWLYDQAKTDHKGRKFDSSRDHNEPFTFRLGGGEVIPGWDQGVAGMRVGGQRTLTIPPQLGYGARGAGGVIPPNATLVFEVELLKVD